MSQARRRAASLALLLVACAGCGSKEWSGSVHVSERLTSLTVTEGSQRFETTLMIGLTAFTDKAYTLPSDEPVEVELELVRATLDGRALPVKLKPSADLSVDPSGRRASWSTFVSGPSGPHKVETLLSADAPDLPSPVCGSNLPVAIEVRWKVIPRGSWKLTGSGAGVAKTLADATAFVVCETTSR